MKIGQKTGIEDLPGDDWEARFTKQVVRNIARYKDERRMSTVDLAARYSKAVGELGALKPTTLNNLLAGKRSRIAITEILIFAQALEVSPASLVFAGGGGKVEMSPLLPAIAPADGLRMFLGESAGGHEARMAALEYRVDAIERGCNGKS